MFIFVVVIDVLQVLLGDCFLQVQVECDLYGQFEMFYCVCLFDVVVFFVLMVDVLGIMVICYVQGVLVIGWGIGILFEGYVLVLYGGLVVDLMWMDWVLDICVEDLQVSVQFGVICEVLNIELCVMGLFFLVDFGVNVSFGGMVVICVSGMIVVCYGMMCDNVLVLEVVLVDGCVICIGMWVVKFSVGYDLIGLFVGLEGMLGIIIELMLCLYGQFEEIVVVVCVFVMLEVVVECVIVIIQLGILMVWIEFIDVDVVCVFNVVIGIQMYIGLYLMVEFYGSLVLVVVDVQVFGVLVQDFGGIGFDWVIMFEVCVVLWKMCYNVYCLCLVLWFGVMVVVIDVCVLMLYLFEVVVEVVCDICVEGLFGLMVGYVGDGNFYFQILVMFGNDVEMVVVKCVVICMVECVLLVGGMIIGEYGVGIGKCGLMCVQYGDVVDVMVVIKVVLDLQGIMNFGKMLFG